MEDIKKESEEIAGISDIYGSNYEEISETNQVMPASSISLTESDGIGKIDIVLIDCKRCGHKWVPRVPVVRICPSCKSPYWNVEKTRFFNGNNNSKNSNNSNKILQANNNSNKKNGKRKEKKI